MTRGRNDRGSAPVEVAVIAPAILALLMVVIYAGRVSRAGAEVQSAASAAARAASQQASVEFAVSRAEDVAGDNLADAGIACTPDVVVDTGDFHPGGSVQVVVSCTTALADLMFIDVPSSVTLTATSTEVIDTFRGGGP